MTSQLAKDAQNDKLTLANYLSFLNTHETVTALPDGGRMKITVRLNGHSA